MLSFSEGEIPLVGSAAAFSIVIKLNPREYFVSHFIPGYFLKRQLVNQIFFKSGKKTFHAGVDPTPNQSGKQESKSTPSSKRGFPELRKTLFLIMSALLQKAPPDDPVFRFLDKKRAEGKPFHVYITAGCNKFLRIYYGKVKEHLASLDTAE